MLLLRKMAMITLILVERAMYDGMRTSGKGS